MEGALRTLILFALAGAVVSMAAWGAAARMDPRRRLKRALRRVLEAEPDAEILAPTQGRAAGIALEARALAVLWDLGVSGLVYPFEELEAAELIIDGEVKARVRRGDAPRPLDQIDPLAEQVVLRFVFDAPRFPEFELALHDMLGPGEDAVREGRRWLAQVEAVLRRTPRPAPVPQAED